VAMFQVKMKRLAPTAQDVGKTSVGYIPLPRLLLLDDNGDAEITLSGGSGKKMTDKTQFFRSIRHINKKV